ncbi:MAG: hypothetical protein LBV61_03500 [Burkholderiaceae bacterium]|nr:hypothetical protein [Burkholderiaceae bacterium]
MDFQLIALAGRNRATLQALQNLARKYPGRLLAQGDTRLAAMRRKSAALGHPKTGRFVPGRMLGLKKPLIDADHRPFSLTTLVDHVFPAEKTA